MSDKFYTFPVHFQCFEHETLFETLTVTPYVCPANIKN